ncbi:MAG TPA: DNA translocase FtsK 4TM domain-containing protein [Candidatus Saccharimonadales bacterium]|nr:DNA translocase FtsK 4TM domain-containing protein [Candidatus Saccharimonadales bacterium]
MAKKKKRKGNKKEEPSVRSPFWPLAGAILLIVAALFMLLGGFGTGGPLPTGMFGGTYAAVGWAAYLVPFAFIYWGVQKFKSEDHHISFGKLVSIFGVVIFTSAWLFTAFASKTSETAPWAGGHGGKVGELLGTAALTALDTFPASLLFAVFTALSVFFAFGISPKDVVLFIASLFRRPERSEGELAELKARAEASGFKVNESVPVEHHAAGGRFAGLRGGGEKAAPTPVADHAALTTATDPNWQFPAYSLLDQKQDKADAGDVNGNAQTIKETFSNFNIDV